MNARLTFASSEEPWIYCASHYGSNEELRRLQREFDVKYGYSVATRVLDPSAFAAWLGVDFALGLDKATDVSLGSSAAIGYARSSYSTSLWDGSRPVDTFVHVYYGPVDYGDVSGRVAKREQLFDPRPVRRLGSPRKPPSRARTSIASQSRRLALP